MTDAQSANQWTAPPEPPGPAPGVAFAPLGERFLAYLIDVIIVTIFIMLAAIVASAVFASGLSGTPQNPSVTPAAAGGFGLIMLIVFVVATAYFPWFWMRGGATPGMKRFNLRVVNDKDGGRVTGGQAVLRFIGLWVSSLVFYLGYIWALIDSRRRGWHDLIAGTVVIKG